MISHYALRRLPVTFCLLLASANARGEDLAAKYCPALPANSGFTWDFKAGIDFFLCYGRSTTRARPFFGVYQGYAPNFAPDGGELRINGVVGGHDVIWYTGSDEKFKLVRQTVFGLGPPERGGLPKAHVWVYADSESELTEMLEILRSVKFNDQFWR